MKTMDAGYMLLEGLKENCLAIFGVIIFVFILSFLLIKLKEDKI